MDTKEQLQKAAALHQSGQILEAGQIYRDVLLEEPGNPDALNLLGVVMQAAGDLETAIDLLTQATELAPNFFGGFANLGNALQAFGRLDDAVNAFEQAIVLNPESMETANNLASVYNEQKRFDEAKTAAEKAISLYPNFPEALVNKGNALAGLCKEFDAIEAYTSALSLNPMHASALFNLANAYADQGNYEAAVAPYQRAIAVDDGDADKHFNLAITLLKLDRFAAAVAAFEAALELQPEHVDALCNIACALQSLGRTGEAIERLSRAIAHQPDSPDLHWNLALASLQHGDYETGWREYKWRWQTPTFIAYRRNFEAPEWNGEDLQGRTLLIHTEQGFGDGIQFCRLASQAAAAGGRVVLECRPQLTRLLGSLDGVAERIDLGQRLPDYDVQIPLMCLPRVLGLTLQSVPTDIPYLSPPEGVAIDSRIAEASCLKVGLAWAGSRTRLDNSKRSCDLAQFAGLFKVPNVKFFSLQVGDARDQLGTVPVADNVVDLGQDFADFADTAAAIQALDLVISVDTSVLHLAGALGEPAWGVLSAPSGFLWMNDREDSPWYPTIRLFRQPEPGDWTSVFAKLCTALVDLAVEERKK